MATAAEHLAVITRGAVDVHVPAELTSRIEAFLQGKRGPLRVKAGFDPTRPDLHLGHCVLLQKLRQLQDLGHQVIFLVGDYTAMVGDPTGQNDARPRLTREQVLAAAETYQEQSFKVLDKAKTEVRYNGEWLAKLSTMDLIELLAKSTIARILERDDFAKRWREQRPIFGHEFLYPLLQGYDSVALDADLELGGTDQLFNLNVGRDLMPRYGKPAQCVLTTPLLEGLDARLVDGKIVGKKMSKSADNYIGIAEPPAEMFRKAMLIDDAVIWRYFELLSSLTAESIKELRAATSDPREPKRLFAIEMVTRFWSAEDAGKAEEEFRRVYTEKKGVPDDIAEHELTAAEAGLWIAKALAETKLVVSSSEGKRLVKDGGVEVDGVRITDERHALPVGGRYLLRAGAKKQRYAYVTVKPALALVTLPRRAFFSFSLAAFGLATGCGKPAVKAPGGGLPPLHLAPLSDLAPAAGLRWLLLGRPGALVQPTALGTALAELVTADRLDALAELLGFDVRLADEAVVADYGSSTLFLFRVAHDPEIAERRFRERVPGAVTRVVHEPRIVRVTGNVGRTARSTVFLDGRVVALEVGGESYARAAVGFASGKLHKAKPALQVAPLTALSAHFRENGDPPLVLLAPNPAGEPWKVGAHGLLPLTSAVGIAAVPRDGKLAVELVALGQYGDAPGPVKERLVATVNDVVSSPLGTLTGVAEPVVGYVYEVSAERLRVTATWDGVTLARGLRAATSASIAEILGK